MVRFDNFLRAHVEARQVPLRRAAADPPLFFVTSRRHRYQFGKAWRFFVGRLFLNLQSGPHNNPS